MLVSQMFIFMGGFMVLAGLAVLVVSFFMDMFGSEEYTQGKTDYSFDFTEHQNYWEADK